MRHATAASRGTSRTWLSVCLLLAAITLLPGCASIFGTESETLPIASDPPDAQILITDEMGYTVYRGRTPSKVPLPKGDGRYFGGKTFSVAISKKGYATHRVTVDTHPNAWYLAGNILAGGVIGWLVIDPVSGKMYELSRAGIEAKLKPLPGETQQPVTALPVAEPTAAAVPAISSSSAADLRPVNEPTNAVPPPPVSTPALIPTSTPASIPPAPAAAMTQRAEPPVIYVGARPPPQAITPPAAPVAEPAGTPPPRPSDEKAPSVGEPPANASSEADDRRPTEYRTPPPYWPAPPTLPVSPSTRLVLPLLLAEAG